MLPLNQTIGAKHLQVSVRDNNVDQVLRVLKRKMQREGMFREMKRRRFYEKPSDRTARERSEAIRRRRKLARKQALRDGLIAQPKKRIEPARRQTWSPTTPIHAGGARLRRTHCDFVFSNRMRRASFGHLPGTPREESCRTDFGHGAVGVVRPDKDPPHNLKATRPTGMKPINPPSECGPRGVPNAKRAVVRVFNARLLAGRTVWVWPTVRAALTSKHPWLVVACARLARPRARGPMARLIFIPALLAAQA